MFDYPRSSFSSASLQLYLLRNGGPNEVQYKVDTAPLRALARDNWGFPVLRLLCPEQGSIGYQGVAALQLQVGLIADSLIGEACTLRVEQRWKPGGGSSAAPGGVICGRLGARLVF